MLAKEMAHFHAKSINNKTALRRSNEEEKKLSKTNKFLSMWQTEDGLAELISSKKQSLLYFWKVFLASAKYNTVLWSALKVHRHFNTRPQTPMCVYHLPATADQTAYATCKVIYTKTTCICHEELQKRQKRPAWHQQQWTNNLIPLAVKCVTFAVPVRIQICDQSRKMYPSTAWTEPVRGQYPEHLVPNTNTNART